MPGGRRRYTLDQLERRCLPQLTAMVAGVTKWRPGDRGAQWKIGDCAVLIVETTVNDASLYVQLLSEPLEPVLWEVCSGNWNPEAKPYIEGEPAARIVAMGFTPGGETQNFHKEVSVRNRGDAAAVARSILRVFYEAFGYRGATPLAVAAFREERASEAVVHTSFTIEDAQKLLVGLGFEATKAESAPTTLFCSRDGVPFMVTLDVPAPSRSLHECMDFNALVGSAAEFADTGWINQLNQGSRVCRASIDEDGDVILSTGVILLGGVTEAYMANRINGWFHAVVQALQSKKPEGKRGRRRRRAPRSGDGPGEAVRGGAPVVIH